MGMRSLCPALVRFYYFSECYSVHNQISSIWPRDSGSFKQSNFEAPLLVGTQNYCLSIWFLYPSNCRCGDCTMQPHLSTSPLNKLYQHLRVHIFFWRVIVSKSVLSHTMASTYKNFISVYFPQDHSLNLILIIFASHLSKHHSPSYDHFSTINQFRYK